VVRITVFQNPELTLETRITEAGVISYPLIGSVRLGGQSVTAAEKIIADGLRNGNFVKNPQVTLVLMQVRGNQANVLGQVNRPGRYPIEVADMRLTETGRRLGLVDDARWDAFCRKRDAVSRETERLRTLWVNPRTLPAGEAVRVLGKEIDHEYCLAELLRRPGVDYASLMSLAGGQYATPELPVAVSLETSGGRLANEPATPEALFVESVVEQVETMAKYSGYIDRQRDEIDRVAHFEGMKLPGDLDYLEVTALSFEARQILARHRPETLGMASRISGITPATISLLLVHLKKKRGRGVPAPGVADGAPDKVAA
jgi:hypothetical protein